MENKYPGMWNRWYQHQCVAVGWHAAWGYPLQGKGRAKKHWGGWTRARTALQRISIGDRIVVALAGHRVGRIGEVTAKRIDDMDWEPLVPRTKLDPDGEMGRRILVRWDMITGPEDRDQVIRLPEGTQFSSGELRHTIAEIQSVPYSKLMKAMNDPTNWVGLLSHFPYERALSDFIAAYPHRLEDGLELNPSEKLRERVFKDRSRADVLLIDRDQKPVIVECKQYAPSLRDLEQIRRYMKSLKIETGKQARGILVHGGARKLHQEVIAGAEQQPSIEIVQYQLDVGFTACM